MNKKRRKEVNRALGMLEEAHQILEQVASEEREAYDGMSEGLQQGERGQQIDTNASALESAHESVQSAIDEIGNVEGGGE